MWNGIRGRSRRKEQNRTFARSYSLRAYPCRLHESWNVLSFVTNFRPMAASAWMSPHLTKPRSVSWRLSAAWIARQVPLRWGLGLALTRRFPRRNFSSGGICLIMSAASISAPAATAYSGLGLAGGEHEAASEPESNSPSPKRKLLGSVPRRISNFGRSGNSFHDSLSSKLTIANERLSFTMRSKEPQPKRVYPIVMYACRSTYITFGIITGFPLTGYLLLPVFGRPFLWEPVGIFLFAFVFAMAWIRSFKITLYDDHISYKTLFSVTTSLNYSEVAKAKIDSGGQDKFGPVVKLVVRPTSSSKKQSLVINAKVFSREDLREILSVLNQKDVH